MDWIGMGWNGIDWSGANFHFEIYFRNNSSPNHSNGKTLVYVAMCIRKICSCVICILHIVKYRVTIPRNIFIHFLCTNLYRIIQEGTSQTLVHDKLQYMAI